MLAVVIVPALPPSSASACSAPMDFELESFEAVAVSHVDSQWEFRLDDGTIRAVTVFATDTARKNPPTRTTCDIAGPPPGVGGRYQLAVMRRGQERTILSIGGSLTELVPPPATAAVGGGTSRRLLFPIVASVGMGAFTLAALALRTRGRRQSTSS